MPRNLPIIGRRRLLQTAALGGAAISAPWVWRKPALAQDKPAELIVRAWGGVWVEVA